MSVEYVGCAIPKGIRSVEGCKYSKKLVILRYCGAGEWHEEHAGRLIMRQKCNVELQ